MKTRINVDLNLKIMLPVIISLLLLLTIQGQAQAAFPEHFDFGDNYYTVYGGPNLTASVLGDTEFERGDTVIININLMNKGFITGFKVEEDLSIPASELDRKLQQTEFSYEAQKTTAIGIMGVLTSLDPAVKVKSGPQEAGTLPSGQQTENPLQYTIEIANNAQAGTYPLLLTLMYGFQENIQISGDNKTDIGITNLEVGMWYEIGGQNISISVSVKEEARFQVTGVSGELVADEERLLSVTYKNVGDLPIKDATVRISASDPFSTTDDQAFIGSIAPGESAVALFNLKVDETATPKMYAINSEIKYEDVDGHDRISDVIKIQVETLPAIPTSEKLGNLKIIVVGLLIVVVLTIGLRVYKNRKK
ncbi:MAG: COG1361 S-layer family protein [Methanosarcinaceae archaeon]